jgi:hypothetical protein
MTPGLSSIGLQLCDIGAVSGTRTHDEVLPCEFTKLVLSPLRHHGKKSQKLLLPHRLSQHGFALFNPSYGHLGELHNQVQLLKRRNLFKVPIHPFGVVHEQ